MTSKNPAVWRRRVLFSLIVLGFLPWEGLAKGFKEPIEKWTFLPYAERVFPPFIADPLETQTGVFFLNGHKSQGNIGYQMPIVDYTQFDPESAEFFNWSVGFEGTMFSLMRILPLGGFTLEATDTKLGFFTSAVKDSWQTRISFTHISSHFADGLFQENPDLRGYSREYFKVDLAYGIPSFRVYTGTMLVFHVAVPQSLEGEMLFAFQWGAEANSPRIWDMVAAFIAADANIREDTNFGRINYRILSGLEIHGDKVYPLRVAFEYYQGFDWRGNFFDKLLHRWGIGILTHF